MNDIQNQTHEQKLINKQAVKIGHLMTQIDSMEIVIEEMQAEITMHRNRLNEEAAALAAMSEAAPTEV